MAITAAAQPGNVPPRVQISISGLSDPTTTILRNDPDGRSRPVRSAEPATLTSGAAVVLDYEAPYGAPVTYTSTPPVNSAETSAAVTLNPTQVWLIHPGVPDLSVGVDVLAVTALENRSRAARSGTHQPLGRSTPIVVSAARASAQTGITVVTDTLAQRDAMWALLDGGTTLLLNIPASAGFGVTREYVAVGDVTEQYVAGANPARIFALPYTVVDRPVGALLPQWTYTGALTKYGTYADILTTYTTYSSFLANTV